MDKTQEAYHAEFLGIWKNLIPLPMARFASIGRVLVRPKEQCNNNN
jgi:hypothetical protein